MRAESKPRLHPEPAENERGFTLVELLVGIVVAAILAGILFQFIQGQGEFARFQSAREEVQANSRLVLEMIGSDIRGAPPLAIQVAAPNSIRLYSPRNWGVVCQISSAQVNLANSVTVRMAGSLSAEFAAGTRGWGIAVGQSTGPSAPPGAWAFMPNVSVSGTTCPSGAGSIQAAAGGPVDERSFSNTATGFVSAPAPAPQTFWVGTIAFVYEEVAYDVAPDADGRFYVRRMFGYNGTNPNMENLAGPLPSASGLQFQYLNRDGVLLDPVADPTQLAAIAAVQVVVQTESSQRFGNARTPQDTRDTTLVRLRN